MYQSRPELREVLADDREYLTELLEKQKQLPARQADELAALTDRHEREQTELTEAVDRCRQAIARTERKLQ